MSRLRGSWGFIAPTPLGHGWGWRERAIEISFLPLSLVIGVIAVFVRAVMWVAEKVVA